LRWLVTGTLLVAGCIVDLPAPAPTDVVPSWGYNGEDTLVTIAGAHFYPQVEVDATGGSEALVNAGFSVSLEGGGDTVSLSGVSLQDYRHIQAIVPAGANPGLYDVVVEGPTGRIGRAEDVFTVSDTRADRIVVDSETVVYEVFETAWVEVFLVDPEGERVLADLSVVVIVTDDVGAVVTTFEDDGLEDQQPFATGYGIRGRLGDDGYALVGLAVGTPNTVDITAAPGLEDSAVAEGILKLLFEPGSELALEIDLPTNDFQTTAGTTFPVDLTLLDQYGNPVENQNEIVLLKNACETWVDAVQILSTAQVDVTLREMTGTTACPVDRILSVSGPLGQSDDITVLPGPTHEFEVLTTPDVVVAGMQDLNAFLTPVDAWGNRVNWTGSELVLTDSMGGVGDYECISSATPFCTVQPLVAGDAVVLTVEDDSGITGTSNPYQVLPADPAELAVVVDGTPTQAGVPTAVTLWVRDTYDNVIDDQTWGAGDFAFSMENDTPDCVIDTPPGDGSIAFGCTFSLARTDAVLEVTLVDPELAGSSDPFEVQNGPLVAVIVEPAAATVEAGQPLAIDFSGFDAWGNPYLDQVDPVLDLANTGGTVSPTQVTLGTTGEATEDAVFTRAGTTQVVAYQGGVELGRSETITVQPADSETLLVRVGAPWVWVDAVVEPEVEVVDLYGNRTLWSGTVTLTALSGNAPQSNVAVSNGFGTASIVWTAPDLSEKVQATESGGLAGESAGFAVVKDCGNDDPTAVVSFGGYSEAILCQDPGTGEAVLLASLEDSLQGASSLYWYAVRADGRAQSSFSDHELQLTLSDAGRYDVEALVAALDGCADAVTADAWVGPNDGEPVGPVVLTANDGSIDIGSETEISVDGVTDCTRDAAVGGRLFLRTDRGTLGGVAQTGAGLAVTLGSGGNASVTLDASAATTDGLATVHAWVPTESASGEETVSLVGDNQHPTVWAQSPAGDTAGTVDTVVLGFSEPLLGTTVIPGNFTVTGPTTPTVTAAVPSADGDEVTLDLDPAVDAGAGTWTVTASLELRDLSGNKLDGAWTGQSADYVGTFGDLTPAVDPVSGCIPDLPVFRPDGDDGSGSEADWVTLTLESNSAPTWWVVSVRDDTDALVHRTYEVPAGPGDTWTWDGRGIDGRVLSNGAYQIAVDADDGQGNRGGACSAVVSIDNPGGE